MTFYQIADKPSPNALNTQSIDDLKYVPRGQYDNLDIRGNIK